MIYLNNSNKYILVNENEILNLIKNTVIIIIIVVLFYSLIFI